MYHIKPDLFTVTVNKYISNVIYLITDTAVCVEHKIAEKVVGT